MIKTESLIKMGGVIALLATTLAVSDSATAINLTIGNSSSNSSIFGSPNFVGQSFINDPTNGTGASILLNDWTFGVYQFNGGSLTNQPITGSAILKIYAGTGIGSTLIGSATTYTTAGSGVNSTANWTFAGGLSLIDNQIYTAVLEKTSGASPQFRTSNANPYANGIVTQNSGNSTGSDTVFSANFSAAPTAVPFDFEPTGGLLVLGGGWLLRRHLKKRAKKD
jgi:hypothetical protein